MSALENIRKGLSSSGSTLIVGILIVGLVATFGNFLGTDNAFSNQKVLEINGQDISIQEFSLEANRLNSIFSNQEISLEQDQVTQIAQDSLIQRILLAQQSDDNGFYVTESFVKEIIQADPTFSRDGMFNLDIFRGFLLRSGLGAEEFQNILRTQYKSIQLNEALNASAFIPDDHLNKFVSSINHHRDITFKRISLADEANKESLSKEEIINYYNEEGFQFMVESKASFSIIDLNTNFLESKVQVTDSEVSAELINLEEQSSNSGQKRISHIQVDFESLSKIEALQKVGDIKNQIDSGLISFEEAVTNFSDDLGSKSLEGDLGYTDGTIFPVEFEEVIKDLSLNEISSVVELSSSLHLIKLTESNEDSFTAKDARNSLIDKKTQSLFVSIEENILSSIDGNKNLIEISQFVDLPIKSFSNVSLNDAPEYLKTSEDFLDAYDSLSPGEIIELPIDNDRLVFLEVEEFYPERQKTLEEAEEDITEILKFQKAKENLNNLVDKSVLLFAQTSSSELTSYDDLKRDTSLLPNSMVSEIFSLRKDQINQIRRFDAIEGDTYVYTLDSIDEIELEDSSEEDSQQNEFAKSAVINIEDSLFMEQLRSSASIKLGNLL
ncbi:SurA N-terminal domain-containing protein [SAR86 cluster bacterium]|nr:SurA N-terminal domain-containing protein [SAR86 cluster bacterium]